jgi:hypothetical protein
MSRICFSVPRDIVFHQFLDPITRNLYYAHILLIVERFPVLILVIGDPNRGVCYGIGARDLIVEIDRHRGIVK